MGGTESNRAVLGDFHFVGFNGDKYVEVALEGTWILKAKK
jgi:hypothetical protein